MSLVKWSREGLAVQPRATQPALRRAPGLPPRGEAGADGAGAQARVDTLRAEVARHEEALGKVATAETAQRAAEEAAEAARAAQGAAEARAHAADAEEAAKADKVLPPALLRLLVPRHLLALRTKGRTCSVALAARVPGWGIRRKHPCEVKKGVLHKVNKE